MPGSAVLQGERIVEFRSRAAQLVRRGGERVRYHRHAPGREQRHALRLVEPAGGHGELLAPRLAFS